MIKHHTIFILSKLKRKKTQIILAVIAVLPIHVFGLSGLIDSTNNHWGIGGNVSSPIIIDSNLVIKDGITLTIEPSTQILINGDINISGKNASLNAIGSLDEFIEIRPISDGLYNKITIGDSLFVNFKFCKFNDLFLDIRDSKGDVQIYNCLLLSSHINITRAYAKIVNNTFYSRRGDYGIYISSSYEYQEIINNIIDDQRGGMFCFYHYTYARYNLVTSENPEPGFSPILPYCDSFDGTPHPDSSYFQGNLLGSPHFVDAENGDFHLSPKSLAIDAGEPSFEYSLEPEDGGQRINIGMYGNTSEAAVNTVSNTSSLSLNPNMYLDAFPNPSFGEITINYKLPKTAKSPKLSLFDLKGYVHKSFPVKVGLHTNITLKNTEINLSSGAYLLRLETRGTSINKKILIIR
jgi:hypothetical protein